jgi:preprotein translocase subunit SecA
MSVMGMTSGVIKGIKGLPRKVFGTRNDRLLKRYRRLIEPIAGFEQTLRGEFDERLAQRVAEEKIDELPEEERDAARQRLSVELSADLLERTVQLRERAHAVSAPVHEWWQSLDPTMQVQEYYKSEYRKKHAQMIEELDENGVNAEAFAVLREASRRAQAHRHFDCQLIGGRVLYEGRIAEMKTGEGKTIVCHLSAFINSLCGLKVHIVTVNDYLVKRDAEFAKPIFELVGLSVGYIQSQVDPSGREGIRQAAYACDITYGTNSEFGFDYLRDNMKSRLEDQVQGSLDYVIVDEVDSILIDEARTPLIISGPTMDDVSRYARANKVAEELVRRQAVWDRKVRQTVARYDGDPRNIPKLDDAMRILGYRKSAAKRAPTKPVQEDAQTDNAQKSDEVRDDTAALGPDFLNDDQVEAIQFFENDVLNITPAEQYRRLFIVQNERKQVGLTHEGVSVAQEALDIGSLYSGANMEWPHLIESALRAHKVYERDRDYVVQDGQVIIVDQFTGRLMHGRQWSDGLHQAVEAKENVRVKEETQTLATITIQNFIKLYRVKAGMTGTAATEATEFDKIYRIDVVEIPTNRPVNRIDCNDKMYRNIDQKYNAIVDEIHETHRRGRPDDPFLLADILTALRPILEKEGRDVTNIDKAMNQFNNAEFGDRNVINFMLQTYDEAMGDLVRGRPVLVGTTSVENSEKLSRLLTSRYAIEHEVLNAKNHAREADIVAKAGHTSVPATGRDKTPRGHVTIATNMAGRGTDIKLGPGVVYEKCKVPAQLPDGIQLSVLYPPGVTKCCINCEEYDPATNCAHCYKPKIDPRFPALGRNVCKQNPPCGLHIIGTERHESRRIDNQLRGRAGRQGDPGSSRFSLSLEDDLIKLFMPDWMLKMMEKLGFTEGTSMEDKRLNKGIERAQRKVEERNFSTRKHLLEWDEPMDYQRKEFYTARQRILEERDLPSLILETINETISSTLNEYLDGHYDRRCIAEWCRSQLDLNIAEDTIDTNDLEMAERSIRINALDSARDAISTSIGEYIDAEEPPTAWDVGGLLNWAQKMFKVSLTQNQMRKMNPREIEDALFDAAEEHYNAIDLTPIAAFLDPHYHLRSLCEWARTKFNTNVALDDVIERPREEIENMLLDRIQTAYQKRVIEYPVDWCLERALAQENTDSAAAADMIVSWVNLKYNVGWTLSDVQDKTVSELRERLLKLQREFLDSRMADEIEKNIVGKSREEVIEWAKQRFGRAWNQRRFDQHDGEIRDALIDQGREMLRWELTRLEQYVLLRIYDQAWKDHLLEMDHLKDAIAQRPLGGDQTHPQSQYAIEGRELFARMQSRVAQRVTDIVFKVQAAGGEAQASAAQQQAALSFRHADATGGGFSSADQQAAMKAQNVEQVVETIRREQPKVGRNDPCPCGSGKKYKQCHGKRG